MIEEALVIGVDYGTDSVRTILADAKNGRELASSIFLYPRWKKGLYCDAGSSQFRQHPLDYIEGIESGIKDCLLKAGPAAAAKVKAISIDTTGSTPVAVNAHGIPLSLTPAFSENPNAMFVLWKDHTAVREAARINDYNRHEGTPYLKNVGGIYSSEWFWAKLMHILNTDTAVAEACYSWVEHCDWIPFMLAGGKQAAEIKRGVCAAGHKSLWAEEFGGLPPDIWFTGLDPLLSGYTARLFNKTFTADQAAGTLCEEWAARLGLPASVKIGIGAFDAHMGAVGGQIEPYYLSKVMGTSTCDMLIAPLQEMQGIEISGICGQVPGSIIPGMLGMEAGQSAFGDTFAWFRRLLEWPLTTLQSDSGFISEELLEQLKNTLHENLIPSLSLQAALIPVTADSEMALDWLNGRRTPNANQELRAAIFQLNLASDAPAVFRALAESICFGAKQIVECFTSQGIPVKGIIGLGGVARKSPFTMQLLADILNLPVRVHSSEQSCAMGAAMFAATVAGIYPAVEDAMAAMGQGFEFTYLPDSSKTALFSARYAKFKDLAGTMESKLHEI